MGAPLSVDAVPLVVSTDLLTDVDVDCSAERHTWSGVHDAIDRSRSRFVGTSNHRSLLTEQDSIAIDAIAVVGTWYTQVAVTDGDNMLDYGR